MVDFSDISDYLQYMNPVKDDCSIGETCCRVESIVSVDERGQMVLPKEIRERADIKPGEKLAVIGWESKGQLCCISLIKTNQLGDMVKSLLGPMLAERPEERNIGVVPFDWTGFWGI